MKHLNKLINSSKKVTFPDFLGEVEEFIALIRYDVNQEDWESDYTLNDIIRYSGHNCWISFKKSLEANNHRLIELIIETNPEHHRINNIIKLILKRYLQIYNFITSHLPSPDFYTHWSTGKLADCENWRRLDIAFELQHVILRIIRKIEEIDQTLIPSNNIVGSVGSIEKTLPKLEDNRLNKIFIGLLAKEYVAISENNQYIWKGDSGLYGYFVDIVSEQLKMRPDSGKIPWIKFRDIIMNHNKLLTTAQDRVSKYNSELLTKPNGYQAIYEIIMESLK